MVTAVAWHGHIEFRLVVLMEEGVVAADAMAVALRSEQTLGSERLLVAAGEVLSLQGTTRLNNIALVGGDPYGNECSSENT